MTNAMKSTDTQDIWDERRLRVATDAGGIALYSWNVDTDRITMDKRAFEIWGLPKKDEITFEQLSACVLPADLDRVKEAFNATRDLSGSYEMDFRILHGDEIRWVSARGRGDDQGIIDRIMYGVFIDVSARKQAEESWEIVSNEMHHRITNLFTLSSALASIAARGTTTKDAMLADLTERLRGLAAAHDLILHVNGKQQTVKLCDLLSALLKPYLTESSNSENISIIAPDITVSESAITSVAMLIHELATNSAKYGALSADAGRLTLSCRHDGTDIVIVWTERGGPAPDASALQSGFGRQMKDRIIKQLDGSITRDWTKDGLIVTLRVTKARLGASSDT